MHDRGWKRKQIHIFNVGIFCYMAVTLQFMELDLLDGSPSLYTIEKSSALITLQPNAKEWGRCTLQPHSLSIPAIPMFKQPL